tara:strand:+ start:324 stop:1169 length:846 start_codon:yes stop_codon:yes gene_type:complete
MLKQLFVYIVLIVFAVVIWDLNDEYAEYIVIPGASSPTPPRQRRVHIMSFNVNALPDVVMLFRNKRAHADKVVAFIEEHMGTYDVICLQEVFSNVLRPKLDKLFQAHGWTTCRENPTGLGIRPESGLYTACRWGMTFSDRVVFSGEWVDALARKGAMAVYIHGVNIRVINVHLQDRHCDFMGTRISQIYDMRRKFGGGIYIGDFNEPDAAIRRDTYGKILGRTCFPSTPTQTELNGNTYVLDGAFLPAYVQNETVEVVACDVSDHRPIHISFDTSQTSLPR